MGGSGGAFVYHNPEELRDLVRKAEERTSTASFNAELAGILSTLLGSYNARDEQAVRQRLETVLSALEGSIEGTFDQFFGGSVAKHTYVDGLSDVDSIVLINDSQLESLSPESVLSAMAKALAGRLGEPAKITHGRMAVTIDYDDGKIIQLLPALRDKQDRLRVPSSRGDDWSNIDPVKFQEALSRRNQECAGKLVPTIKLAKAIIGQLPESQRLSGYHIESLGIAAFRGYNGGYTTSAMLPLLFERARELVLSPIKDSTGQSVHVDEYLGPANSEPRHVASHVLGRLARRMHNATAAQSAPQWRALFGLDE